MDTVVLYEIANETKKGREQAGRMPRKREMYDNVSGGSLKQLPTAPTSRLLFE